jgi:nitrous oxidase accessory protein NosD
VDKSVTLKGVGQPVVDAGGKGNAVTLTLQAIHL